MPSIYDLKPAFQNQLRPLCHWLAKNQISANQVTLAAMVLSVAHGLWIYVSSASAASLLFLPVTLFIRMALNAIDGMLAREYGQKSLKGALLNELGDVVSDVFLYLPLALHPAINPTALILFVALGIITETAGITAQTISGERRYDGPMGKSDRAFLLGFVGFMLGLGIATQFWVTVLLCLAIALSALTIWRRAIAALPRG